MNENDVRAYEVTLNKSDYINLEKEVENDGLDVTINK